MRDRLKAVVLACVACSIPYACAASQPYKSAPQNYATPWQPPVQTEGKPPPFLPTPAPAPASAGGTDDARPSLPPAPDGSRDVQPGKAYSLPELVDLAQRTNPQTRIAWYQARAAAVKEGIAVGSYFPAIKLVLAAGIERATFPLPIPVFNKGYFTADGYIVRPEVVVEWVALDFGSRTALAAAASHTSDASKYAFNAVHHELAFNVTTAYYGLAIMQTRVATADAALGDAESIEKSVKMKRERGMATEPELLMATQNRVRAEWDREVVGAQSRNAQAALSHAVGLDPSIPLRVQPLEDDRTPAILQSTVNQLVEQAIRNRSDLKALSAEVSAADAAIDAAKSTLLPSLVLRGNAGPVLAGFRIGDAPWVNAQEYAYGAFGIIEWPLFGGFVDTNLVREAENQKGVLAQQLVLARSGVAREVWQAYTVANSALRKYGVAESLLDASQSTYDAMLASFKKGVATLPEVLTAQTALAAARTNILETEAEIRVALAALRFATGATTVSQD